MNLTPKQKQKIAKELAALGKRLVKLAEWLRKGK